ncbi:MAG: M28 family peptidase [Gemmatimonadales bacterium]
MTDYRALLRELAIPRLVGTPNHARVRAALKRELAGRGFVVDEHAFSGRPAGALLGAPRLVQGVNLIAQRPSGRAHLPPRVWLVAHYDSKGQPISMATRLLGVLALAAVAPLLAAGLAADRAWAFLPALAVLMGGVAVMARNRVSDASAGAVDNASALIAVLMVLDLLGEPGGGGGGGVGVVFPDAEEYGLVGTRRLVVERGELLRDAAVVNFDGLDDCGRPFAVLHRAGPVGRAVAAAVGARRMPWLPVIVDGLTLARGARDCVTIMKGAWSTARIVHTEGDTPDRLTLAGARQVAEGVARAITDP